MLEFECIKCNFPLHDVCYTDVLLLIAAVKVTYHDVLFLGFKNSLQSMDLLESSDEHFSGKSSFDS
jgi:hypothetical protein